MEKRSGLPSLCNYGAPERLKFFIYLFLCHKMLRFPFPHSTLTLLPQTVYKRWALPICFLTPHFKASVLAQGRSMFLYKINKHKYAFVKLAIFTWSLSGWHTFGASSSIWNNCNFMTLNWFNNFLAMVVSACENLILRHTSLLDSFIIMWIMDGFL